MKKNIVLSLLAAAVCCLAACQAKPAEMLESFVEGSGASDPAEEEDAEDVQEAEPDEWDLQKLYNTYIDINNHMLGEVNDALSMYARRVDLESEEFSLLKEPIETYACYYPHADRYLGYVEEAYSTASRKAEKDELDKAFLDLYPSLKELITVLGEMHSYTDDDAYLEDDYAKSQEQHTALLGVLGDYFVYGEAFLTVMDSVASQRELEELEQMKAEGYEVWYTLNMVMRTAEQIRDELYEQGIADDNILDMDLEKIRPLYDEFSSYVDTVLEYNDDKEKLKAEGLYISVAGMNNWGFFITAVENTRTSISSVIESVESGEPLSEISLRITSPGGGSVSSFEEGLDSIIESYNKLVG